MTVEQMEFRILNYDLPKQKNTEKSNSIENSKLLKQFEISFKRLLEENRDPNGRLLNYKGMQNSKLLPSFYDAVGRLQQLNLSLLSEKAKKAFFIKLFIPLHIFPDLSNDVYNAITIHGVLELKSIPDTALYCLDVWRQSGYKIGKYYFTLEDVEHGILRANYLKPTSKEHQFLPEDPRLAFTLQILDPHIHFGIAWAAKSAPSPYVYNEDNVTDALKIRTKRYCEDGVRVDSKKSTIILSKMFRWFGNDFGPSDTDVIRWLQPYLSESKQKAIAQLTQEFQSASIIIYQVYDWGINAYTQKTKSAKSDKRKSTIVVSGIKNVASNV